MNERRRLSQAPSENPQALGTSASTNFSKFIVASRHTINSTGNANVPASTYAKVIVDSALSLMRSNGVGERPNSSERTIIPLAGEVAS